jgi:hypothetical protein
MYDWFSWIYSAFSKIGLFFLGTTESRARHEVLDRLEPNGGTVLEVSIGPGVNLPYLLTSPDVGEVYGLDISVGQLNRCNALIICDENESGAQWYEKFLPGFKRAFRGQREAVIAPVDLIPKTMLDIQLENIWNGFFYCLEFRKPYKTELVR